MPDPVLQQVEHFNNPNITQNDAFKYVCRYFDRITRPEQILQSLPQAIQTMIDPGDCGPACISLSQDTQGETFDYPEEFFNEKIHTIRRPRPDDYQIKQAAELIKKSKNPIIISGGGVFYSDAMKEISQFAKKHNIPTAQTVMGYSTMKKDDPYFLGAIGGFGGKAPNNFMKKTDLAIAVGTKLADFTTGSWSNFENPNFKLVSINVSRFDANKHMAQSIVGDAKVSLQDLTNYLGTWRSPEEWYKKSRSAVESWNNYLEKESGPTNQKTPSYAHVAGAIYRKSDPSDIAVTAAGGLVGEVLQVWRPRELNTHETEWGFSCMSYEISGALGIKMANPKKEVIAFVGDGSYLLYNSDIYSSILTNHKLIIIVCDNGGHAVINRLQLYKGGKEFNCLFESSKVENIKKIDFAKHAESLGATGENVNSISELEQAFVRAKKSKTTYVISIKTDGYQWLEGSAFWESPTLTKPSTKENERALKEHLQENPNKDKVFNPMSKVFNVGLIGCGHIAETYFKSHKYFNNFKITKCADINHLAAKKCASTYNIEALSVKNLLEDKKIEIILNLTVPKAHYEVSKKALLHNKHVYTEKPMAINVKDGKELLKISKGKNYT